MSRPPVEFCWQCHGYRVGMTLPHKCEDWQRCARAMADTSTVEPVRVPRHLFDYAELERDRRFVTYLVMGAVAAILVLAFAFA